MIGLAIIFALISHVVALNCTQPSGNDCSWYRDCLETLNPCGTKGYAINYALKYCNKYEQNLDKFSPYGRKWVLSAKKCLQTKLASLIKGKTNEKIDCAYLKKYAFESHIPCYVDPTGFGTPSFCGLTTKDKYEVVRIIKGAFLSEFTATVKGGIDVLKKCFSVLKK